MHPSGLNLIGNSFQDNYGIFGHIEPSSESRVLRSIDGTPLRSVKYMASPRARQEHIAVFIDGANLYAASRALGFDVDYKSLLAYFRQQAYLVRAYYYTALLETEEYSPLRPLVDWLGYNGYSVVTKPAKEFTDATGRRRVKGNMASSWPWMCWPWRRTSTTSCCSPATATSVGWSRRCSSAACG
jgi:hypothetical protein